MDIRSFIRELEKLNWDSPHSLEDSQSLLLNLWEKGNVNDRIAEYLSTLQYPDPAVTRTAELHSWKLWRTPVWDLTLNEFRPFLGETRTASENIHNHTRPLVSLTISGGYEQDYFRLKEHICSYLDGQSYEGRIERYPGPSTYPGMVYITTTDIFHALTDFIPGTMTLVVYGKLEQDCILCFNQLSGQVERRKTATSAKNDLIGTLKNLRCSS